MACHYNWVTAGTLLVPIGAVLVLGLIGVVTVPDLKLKLFGIFLATICGAIVWALCNQLVIANPVLTIDERGVWDRRLRR
jgi:hypothetical protein